MAKRRKVRGVVVQEIEAGRLGSRITIKARRPVLQLDFVSMSRLAWYAVQVRPTTEFLAEANLERRGFAALVPMRKRQRRVSSHSSRMIEVLSPLAPRYVFVGFRGAPDWRGVFALTWVSSVVSLDGINPARMVGTEVARFIFSNMVVDERPIPALPIAAGEEVDVVEGAFAGHRVTVDAIDGEVARVLLPLFGKTTVPVKMSSLVRAG